MRENAVAETGWKGRVEEFDCTFQWPTTPVLCVLELNESLERLAHQRPRFGLSSLCGPDRKTPCGVRPPRLGLRPRCVGRVRKIEIYDWKRCRPVVSIRPPPKGTLPLIRATTEIGSRRLGSHATDHAKVINS